MPGGLVDWEHGQACSRRNREASPQGATTRILLPLETEPEMCPTRNHILTTLPLRKSLKACTYTETVNTIRKMPSAHWSCLGGVGPATLLKNMYECYAVNKRSGIILVQRPRGVRMLWLRLGDKSIEDDDDDTDDDTVNDDDGDDDEDANYDHDNFDDNDNDNDTNDDDFNDDDGDDVELETALQGNMPREIERIRAHARPLEMELRNTL